MPVRGRDEVEDLKELSLPTQVRPRELEVLLPPLRDPERLPRPDLPEEEEEVHGALHLPQRDRHRLRQLLPRRGRREERVADGVADAERGQ